MLFYANRLKLFASDYFRVYFIDGYWGIAGKLVNEDYEFKIVLLFYVHRVKLFASGYCRVYFIDAY